MGPQGIVEEEFPADLQCTSGYTQTLVCGLPPVKELDIAIIIITGHGNLSQKQTK